MGLLVMILGLILFLGVHTLTTQRELRARFVVSMGEGGYKIGYAPAPPAGRGPNVHGDIPERGPRPPDHPPAGPRSSGKTPREQGQTGRPGPGTRALLDPP